MTRCHRVVSVKGPCLQRFCAVDHHCAAARPGGGTIPNTISARQRTPTGCGWCRTGPRRVADPRRVVAPAGKGKSAVRPSRIAAPTQVLPRIVEKLTPNGRLPTMAELSQKSEVASFQWDKFIWQWAGRQPRSVPAASPITRMARTAASGPSLMQLSSTLLLCLIDLKAV